MDRGARPLRPAAPRALTLLAALALVAVAGACGSSAKATTSSTTATSTTFAGPRLAKAAFLAKANAICTATERSLRAAEAQTSASPNQDAVLVFTVRHLVPATRSEVAKIRALGPPVGDTGQIAALLSTMDHTLDIVLSDPQRAIAANNPFAAIDGQLHAYGLVACAT